MLHQLRLPGALPHAHVLSANCSTGGLKRPSPAVLVSQGDRLEEDWVPEQDERPAEEVEKDAAAAEAKNRWALDLGMQQLC